MEYVLALSGVIVSYTDLKYEKIPNLITLPLIAAGLIFNTVTQGLNGLIISMSGLLLGLLFFILPFLTNQMGGGDLKYGMAIGAVLGPHLLINILAVTAVAGMIGGICIMLYKKVFWKSLKPVLLAAFWFIVSGGKVRHSINTDDKLKMPYGIYMAIGIFVTLFCKGVISC